MRLKILLAAFILGLILCGCGGEIGRGRVVVAVSIPPQIEFVKVIGGERVDVVVMVPPRWNPHAYEPPPSKIRALSKAKMYAKVGSGIEFEISWMDKLAKTNNKMLIVDCSKGIKLIDKDPHIWLSPKNAKMMVENIFEGLVEVDPENKEYYVQRKSEYVKRLEKLEEDIGESLKGVRGRKFMVLHPAWGYFAKDYGLEQIAIEEGGKEPSAEDIRNLIAYARENNIKVIFASPGFNPKPAEAIAKEIGGRVVFIDPLSQNYIDNLYKVMREIVEVMG